MKRALMLFILTLMVGCMLAESLNLHPSPELYNIFFASQVDPQNPMTQPVIFLLDVSGTETTSAYRLHIDLDWNGNVLLDDGTVLPRLPFASMQYTSRDIIAEENQYFHEGDFNGEDIFKNNPDFEDAVLETGRFPDGVYHVRVWLSYLATTDPIASAELTFNIVSPISIQLLYPGATIGGQVMPFLEQFPNFIWASNLSQYILSVWELEDAMNMTAEDVENMEPIFVTETNTTTFPYPASAPSLETGKTYAWQVRGGVFTPDGPRDSDGALTGPSEYLKSPVYVFRVGNANENIIYNQILANFLEYANGDDYTEVFDLLNQGFTPTGAIMFNGQEISFEELNALLIQILNGEVEVKGFTIE